MSEDQSLSSFQKIEAVATDATAIVGALACLAGAIMRVLHPKETPPPPPDGMQPPARMQQGCGKDDPSPVAPPQAPPVPGPEGGQCHG